MNLKDAEIQYALAAANNADEDDLDQPILYVLFARKKDWFIGGFHLEQMVTNRL